MYVKKILLKRYKKIALRRKKEQKEITLKADVSLHITTWLGGLFLFTLDI